MLSIFGHAESEKEQKTINSTSWGIFPILFIFPGSVIFTAYKAILFWGFADNDEESLNTYFKLKLGLMITQIEAEVIKSGMYVFKSSTVKTKINGFAI